MMRSSWKSIHIYIKSLPYFREAFDYHFVTPSQRCQSRSFCRTAWVWVEVGILIPILFPLLPRTTEHPTMRISRILERIVLLAPFLVVVVIAPMTLSAIDAMTHHHKRALIIKSSTTKGAPHGYIPPPTAKQ